MVRIRDVERQISEDLERMGGGVDLTSRRDRDFHENLAEFYRKYVYGRKRGSYPSVIYDSETDTVVRDPEAVNRVIQREAASILSAPTKPPPSINLIDSTKYKRICFKRTM